MTNVLVILRKEGSVLFVSVRWVDYTGDESPHTATDIISISSGRKGSDLRPFLYGRATWRRGWLENGKRKTLWMF